MEQRNKEKKKRLKRRKKKERKHLRKKDRIYVVYRKNKHKET